MKLVVENIDPVTLQREKWESYLLHVSKQIEIYSEEGMYIVNGKHVKQIKQVRPSQIHKKTIVLQNNHVLICGGYVENYVFTYSCEIFNPIQITFSFF